MKILSGERIKIFIPRFYFTGEICNFAIRIKDKIFKI